MVKLKELASVRSGLVLARKQAKQSLGVRYQVLNLRSIHPEGFIIKDQLDIFSSSEQLNSEYQTRLGDIIVRLTLPYTAVLIDEATEGIVVSSNFIIIRIQSDLLVPEYLAWLLNTNKVRKQIVANTGGSVLGSVKNSFFSELDIDLFSTEKQKQIATLNHLARRELRLLRNLADEKKKYYAQLICNVQKDMR